MSDTLTTIAPLQMHQLRDCFLLRLTDTLSKKRTWLLLSESSHPAMDTCLTKVSSTVTHRRNGKNPAVSHSHSGKIIKIIVIIICIWYSLSKDDKLNRNSWPDFLSFFGSQEEWGRITHLFKPVTWVNAISFYDPHISFRTHFFKRLLEKIGKIIYGYTNEGEEREEQETLL